MAEGTKLILRALKSILDLLIANNRMLKNMQHEICPKVDDPTDPSYHILRTEGYQVSFDITQYIQKGVEDE